MLREKGIAAFWRFSSNQGALTILERLHQIKVGFSTELIQTFPLAFNLQDRHLETLRNASTSALERRRRAHNLSLYEARKRAFDALASQHGIASEHRHFIPGAPANAIRFSLQRSAYDLLVIGAANHHLLASDIGLTAEGIFEGAGCSVLAIKLPAGAQSPKAVEEARQLEPDLIRS